MTQPSGLETTHVLPVLVFTWFCSVFIDYFDWFSHSWETVAQAAWRKYPNPMNPAVIGTDVVERKVVDGVLITHRLVSSKWYFPKWAQAVSKIRFNYFIYSRSRYLPTLLFYKFSKYTLLFYLITICFSLLGQRKYATRVKNRKLTLLNDKWH